MNLKLKNPVSSPDFPISEGTARVVLDHIFDRLPEAVLIADSQRRVLTANPAACRLFRYDREVLVGAHASALYADTADCERMGLIRDHRGATANNAPYQMRYRRSDGSVFSGETVGGPIQPSDTSETLFFVLIRDVSAEREADRVLAQLYAVTSNPRLTFEASRHAILELGCRYFGMPLGIVSRIRGNQYEVLDVVDSSGDLTPGQVFDIEETYCFEIVARQGPYAVDMATHPDICDHPAYRRFGLASFIGAPLHIKGEFVGSISFASSTSTQAFTEHQLKLVSMFSQWLSHEMERNDTLVALREAHAKLLEIAVHDELTGLGNRRQLSELFHRELDAGHRYGRSLSVAVVDFDHFKRINDTHGHAAGDEALRLFARLALGVLRRTDTVGRWGGEEFLILLPDTDAGGAELVLGRLLDAVRTTRFDVGDRVIPLSVSAGLTTTACDEPLADILERADEALYQAKAAGRDQLARQ